MWTAREASLLDQIHHPADAMICAKLQLSERTKVAKETPNEKPRRFCQRRLVDPEWHNDGGMSNLERFHCSDNDQYFNESDREHPQTNTGDLFLTVQNLQFQGEVLQRKRPKTSFKYKTLPSHRRHRMFVKELVEDKWDDSDHLSELTCYYYDDYAKYLPNNDMSRPSSGKSSLYLYNFVKSIDTDIKKDKPKAIKSPKKAHFKKIEKINEKQNDEIPRTNDTKISYHKSGKRKSLTISRAQSPATVQVIRVDVVCNYSSSSIASDYEDKKQNGDKVIKEKKDDIAKAKSHFANKYLLTNTVKTLDEKAGGARVTLLCKTFKLADRSRIL